MVVVDELEFGNKIARTALRAWSLAVAPSAQHAANLLSELTG